MRAAKTAIAARLRYARQRHPEGPFTLAALAEHANVSKRTLASAESADGTNLTIETLVKVANSLGIQRWGYFLDEEVFAQVNAEWETGEKDHRRHDAECAVAQATSPTSQPSASLSELSELLTGILRSAKAASDALKELPSSLAEPPPHDREK
ncbi:MULTISPECIES: helix-turn-helix domain-containing protein [unclassified Streptomyces]|nr:helix-turn-helix transcriptional regulator [Streptomyces sp. CB02959]PJN42152.1 transcriptional regulator [Streptomyces sp. CB02959]